jgi:hypothetical protein
MGSLMMGSLMMGSLGSARRRYSGKPAQISAKLTQSSASPFGPRFIDGSVLRGLLRDRLELSSPQADTAEGAARRSRFSAAFAPRPLSNPHSKQRNRGCDRASSVLTEPKQQQVLLAANHLSATTTSAP